MNATIVIDHDDIASAVPRRAHWQMAPVPPVGRAGRRPAADDNLDAARELCGEKEPSA